MKLRVGIYLVGVRARLHASSPSHTLASEDGSMVYGAGGNYY